MTTEEKSWAVLKRWIDYETPYLISAEHAKIISDGFQKAVSIINRRVTEAFMEGKNGIYFDGGNNHFVKHEKSEPEDLWMFGFYSNCNLVNGNPLKAYIESCGYKVESYIGLSICWDNDNG